MKNLIETISIVIPAYQEVKTIGNLLTSVLKVTQTLGCKYEIIVVDDGSNDRTGEEAMKAGAKVLTHPYNKGYGASLKTGITFASNNTIIILDADGQHDPNDIPKLLSERQSFNMVVGARKGMSGSPLWRKPGKIVIKWLVNNLTGNNIPDFNSGYRALDRKMILSFLPIMPDGFSFSTTSTIAAFKAGYNVKYIPIQVKSRIGISSVTVIDGFRTIMLIIRLVTLFAPLRVFMPISIITFLIGMIFVINGYFTEGEASLKGLITLLASILFFLFGIMIDQVTAIRRGEIIS